MTRRAIRPLLAAVALLLAAVLFRNLPVADWLERLAELNDAYPVAVPVAYVIAVTIATVALFPGWISLMLAGLLFGLLPGVLYALAGISAGALGAFLAGRGLARPWVEKRVRGNPKLLALDNAVDAQSFYIVFLSRAAIVLPFNLLNYAFGLTRVTAATYFAATVLGMLPAVALYVYLGTLADDIGQILAGEVRPTAGALWIALLAIVAISAGAWIIQRAVARELNRQLQDKTDIV